MPQTQPPAWIAAATSAAVRLAAEAGTEVDDILGHGDAPALLASKLARLEESADVTEVATDLAGLLWAECEDVPPIATILAEPATQAALEAVAEARRQAAQRLVEARAEREDGRPTLPSLRRWAAEVAPAPAADAAADLGVLAPPVTAQAPAAELRPAPAPRPAASPSTPSPRPAAVSTTRGPVTGAVLAGAAAALVLFGRRLRRA